jgi:hypothetical protein
MSEIVARRLLAIGFLFGLLLDAGAAYAWFLGKPWHVVVGLLFIGMANHPGAQPSLRRWANATPATPA